MVEILFGGLDEDHYVVEQKDAKCHLKLDRITSIVRWTVPEACSRSTGMRKKQYKQRGNVKEFFSLSASLILILQELLLASTVEKKGRSPSAWTYLSIQGIAYESRLVTTFSLR